MAIVEGDGHHRLRESFPSAEIQARVEINKGETHLAKGDQLCPEAISETVRDCVVTQNPPVRLGPACGAVSF
jgi:hypothetical protein